MNRSKNILTLVLLFTLSCGLWSCKKDDQEDSVSLIGKWHIEVDNGTVQQPGEAIQKTTTGYARGEFTLEFIGSHTMKLFEEGRLITYPYNYDANSMLLSIKLDDGDFIEYKVKELSKHRLVLFDQGTETSNGVTFSYTQELICSKD